MVFKGGNVVLRIWRGGWELKKMEEGWFELVVKLRAS